MLNGPYVFPVPKNFPDLVRRETSVFAGIAQKIFKVRIARHYQIKACLELSYWKL